MSPVLDIPLTVIETYYNCTLKRRVDRQEHLFQGQSHIL